MNKELEKAFEVAAEENLNKIMKVYRPTIYIQMINRHGHLEAVKRLAISNNTGGFHKLWINHRELLVENLIVDDRFISLFSEKEINESRKKLTPSR